MQEYKQCAVYKKCGGCQLQNMSYPQQLSFKMAKVIKLMSRFGHVDEIIGMSNPLHYRNKVQAAFGTDMRGRIISGVYQSSTHRIVNVSRCMIEDSAADKIIVSIRNMLPEFKLTAYNEHNRRGFLRHVLVRRGFRSGQIMVVLVTATPVFKSKNAFIAELLRQHPQITTVVQSINPGFTSLVLGQRENVLYGNGYIEDELCGCTFRISASSFYQINPVQTELLYNKAIELAGLQGDETVLDAYCGIGTIGLIAAASAGQVLSVELNGDAVRDAIANARRNGIKNVRFYNEDAGRFMVKLAKENEQVDTVFMDPPRAGSDNAFLNSLLQLAPKRVVYISCNPETLARDTAVLVKGGYRVNTIQPVDMFPFTMHVETVVLMTRVLK